MKTLGKVIFYIFDRVFSAIVMGIALAVVLAELIRRGYLNLGG